MLVWSARPHDGVENVLGVERHSTRIIYLGGVPAGPLTVAERSFPIASAVVRKPSQAFFGQCRPGDKAGQPPIASLLRQLSNVDGRAYRHL
jgi:hypothetical protein